MKTITHTLPIQLKINGVDIKLNWQANENLDGFVAAINHGVPINDFKSSEDCEIAIWQQNALKSDVYTDGSATVYFAI